MTSCGTVTALHACGIRQIAPSITGPVFDPFAPASDEVGSGCVNLHRRSCNLEFLWTFGLCRGALRKVFRNC